MSPRRASRASKLRAFAAKLRGFLRSPQADAAADAEIDDEIQEHLQLLTERFIAQGMSRDAAAMAARRRFGNLTALQEDRRALQTLPSIEALWHDVRYAIRTLRRSPGFALVAIVTLGLGIGASTAIFGVIHNVLLSPFPYRDASRMASPRIQNLQQGSQSGRQGYVPAEILEFVETNHVFDATTAAREDLVLCMRPGGSGAEQLYGARVTPGTFEFFGMPALHGRVLQPADYEPGASPAFVMGYKAWIERFGGDPSIVNTTLVLNGRVRTLVGIMPPRFGWYGADVFIPEKLTRDAKEGDAVPTWFFVGHLKPDVSIEQADADLTLIAQRLAKIYPQAYPRNFSLHLLLLRDAAVRSLRPTLYTVLAAVGLLLLIACSNVANLMLARATAREKELALRAALGAGRARLVRLLIVESLVLAMAGAALGVFLAWGGLKALVAAMPADVIPSESVIALNVPVLMVTLGVAVLTALLFGLVPALQSSRRDLTDPLRDSGKGVSGGFRGKRLRHAVVVVEVALSLTLLIGAGLMMRSFVALREIRLGIQTDHVLVAQLPMDRFKTAGQMAAFLRPLLARVQALPGVEHAAVSTGMPPNGSGESKIEIAGRAPHEDWQAYVQQVSEGYFRALRLDLEAGRTFSEADVTDMRHVAVVNETFVRQYLSNDQALALGQRVRLAKVGMGADAVQDVPFEIVGVVGDVANRGLQVPSAPEVWIPSSLTRAYLQVLIVRTTQDPATVTNAVRREVTALDAGMPLANPTTLEQRIGERLYAGPRFGFLVMTVFGCVGLMLVTVGVYSVLAYSTLQRTHEIGLRLALGAERTDVLGMVVRSGLRLVAVGIAIGMAVGLVLARLIAPQLVGVATYDPATLAIATIVLTLTAAIACWIPARRAARVDPMVALRYE
jgi:putative ABC transport system permease protein